MDCTVSNGASRPFDLESYSSMDLSSPGTPDSTLDMNGLDLSSPTSKVRSNRISSGCEGKSRTCKVCNEIAGKHNYYGANVCISCRGFFRRSVQSKQHMIFSCPGKESNQTCIIDSKSRRSCKKCRYDKCLKAGMRAVWVLTPEERKRRVQMRTFPKVEKATILQFTNEERKIVDRLIDMVYSFSYAKYYQRFGEDLDAFKGWMNAVYCSKPMTYEALKRFEEIDKKAMIEAGFKVLLCAVGNESLPPELLLDLVKRNFTKVFGFYWSVFCESQDMEEYMREFIRYGEENPDVPGAAPVLEILRDLRGRKTSWNYDLIYCSPWAACVDIEERHHRITKNISKWPRSGDGMTVDRGQLVLLTIVMLLAPDAQFTKENIDAIENRQMEYVMMLHRYLRNKFGNETTRADIAFANGIQIINLSREAYEMHCRMLPI